jgi:excisionase family DNA binding protein
VILKVSTKTVYNLISRKELPASRVGSLFRITEEQLSRYLESTESGA